MERTPSNDRDAAGDITRLLRDWQAGDAAAAETLAQRIYPELHKMAKGLLSVERRDHTLQPTALLNEAYLRLAAQDRITWQDRHQFFAVAARIIQRVLVDHARKRLRHKRGGPASQRVPLDDVTDLVVERPDLLIELDHALEALDRRDPQLASIVRSKFFGGLTGEQIAETLGCSTRTVKRQWRVAKAWLYRVLTEAPGPGRDAGPSDDGMARV
ncbi:MAG: ECF-type sigma factor [Acidobacteriota bacterium]